MLILDYRFNEVFLVIGVGGLQELVGIGGFITMLERFTAANSIEPRRQLPGLPAYSLQA